MVEDACLPYTGLNQCGIPTPGTPRSSAAAVQCAPGSAPAAGTESDDDLVGLSLVLGDSEQQAPPAPPPVAQGGAAPRASARKLRFTRYRYVGGYYGACTEHAMMEEIFRGGPVVATLFVRARSRAPPACPSVGLRKHACATALTVQRCSRIAT